MMIQNITRQRTSFLFSILCTTTNTSVRIIFLLTFKWRWSQARVSLDSTCLFRQHVEETGDTTRHETPRQILRGRECSIIPQYKNAIIIIIDSSSQHKVIQVGLTFLLSLHMYQSWTNHTTHPSLKTPTTTLPPPLPMKHPSIYP